MKKGKSVICQSCGMPMVAHQHFGTNFDLSINQRYNSDRVRRIFGKNKSWKAFKDK